MLQTTTNALGGARHISNCGQPVTDVSYVSALAWLYHRNVGTVGGFQQGVEKAELRNPNLPKVLFRPVSHGGWSVLPLHTRPSQVARCHGLHAALRDDRQPPGRRADPALTVTSSPAPAEAQDQPGRHAVAAFAGAPLGR